MLSVVFEENDWTYICISVKYPYSGLVLWVCVGFTTSSSNCRCNCGLSNGYSTSSCRCRLRQTTKWQVVNIVVEINPFHAFPIRRDYSIWLVHLCECGARGGCRWWECVRKQAYCDSMCVCVCVCAQISGCVWLVYSCAHEYEVLINEMWRNVNCQSDPQSK